MSDTTPPSARPAQPHNPLHGKTLQAIVEELAEKVNVFLALGKTLTASCWFEVDPAYGSDAYVDQGTELKRVFAEKAAA